MVYAKDMTGLRFGRLQVIERAQACEARKDKHVLWRCLCDCGNYVVVAGNDLRKSRGNTSSCGCYAKEVSSKRAKEVFTTHGKSRESGGKHTRIYNIWACMKQRCECANVPNYKYYGAKGVSVCDEWSNSFESFYNWAIANGYRDDLSIDRINPYGNYCPENCRWATAEEQACNKRSRTSRQRDFIATSPDGEVFYDFNITRFAMSHGLNPKSVSKVLNGRSNSLHGWHFSLASL